MSEKTEEEKKQLIKNFQNLTECDEKSATFFLDAGRWDMNMAMEQFLAQGATNRNDQTGKAGNANSKKAASAASAGEKSRPEVQSRRPSLNDSGRSSKIQPEGSTNRNDQTSKAGIENSNKAASGPSSTVQFPSSSSSKIGTSDIRSRSSSLIEPQSSPKVESPNKPKQKAWSIAQRNSKGKGAANHKKTVVRSKAATQRSERKNNKNEVLGPSSGSESGSESESSSDSSRRKNRNVFTLADIPRPSKEGSVCARRPKGGSYRGRSSPKKDSKSGRKNEREKEAKTVQTKKQSKHGRRTNTKQMADTTEVVIRLVDGTRKVLKSKLTQKVGDIRKYLTQRHPENCTEAFVLVTCLPKLTEINEELTIQEAHIENCVIVQHRKILAVAPPPQQQQPKVNMPAKKPK